MRSIITLLTIFCLWSPIASQAQDDDEHSARWRVKTLSDIDSSYVRFDSVVRSSITEQNALPRAEVNGDTRRLASETTVYEITAYLTGIKRELDGDYHLVMMDLDSSAYMIFEVPNPDRPEVRATSRWQLFDKVKRTIDSLTFGEQRLLIERFLEVPIKLRFTGVGFYDTWHLIPQAGMPPNRRELHPVLTVEVAQ